MACTHPFHAFPTGLKTENGKEDYFLSFTRDLVIPAWQVAKAKKIPFSHDLTEWIEVPCGTCYECRKDKARRWSFRCLFEALDHKENYFITLTYDDSHCPKELVKKDLQDFFKRLRERCGKFRYFACGEYGEKYGRPHFHALLFGLHLGKKLIPLTGGNMPLFRSEEMESCWKFGFSSVGVARPSAVANYIASYTVKQTDKKGFLTMSRKPGIGFDQMVAYLADVDPVLSCSFLKVGDGRGNVVKGSLPRSLREKLMIDPDENIARVCILKIQNEMRACGYKDSWLECLDAKEFYMETKERIDKGKEIARTLRRC